MIVAAMIAEALLLPQRGSTAPRTISAFCCCRKPLKRPMHSRRKSSAENQRIAYRVSTLIEFIVCGISDEEESCTLARPQR
jgi:hypothetical protein